MGHKSMFFALEKELLFGKPLYSFYILQEFMKVLQVFWFFIFFFLVQKCSKCLGMDVADLGMVTVASS